MLTLRFSMGGRLVALLLSKNIKCIFMKKGTDPTLQSIKEMLNACSKEGVDRLINELEEILYHDSDLYDEFLMIRASYSSLASDKIKNTISPGLADRKSSRILENLFALIDQLDFLDLKKAHPESGENQIRISEFISDRKKKLEIYKEMKNIIEENADLLTYFYQTEFHDLDEYDYKFLEIDRVGMDFEIVGPYLKIKKTDIVYEKTKKMILFMEQIDTNLQLIEVQYIINVFDLKEIFLSESFAGIDGSVLHELTLACEKASNRITKIKVQSLPKVGVEMSDKFYRDEYAKNSVEEEYVDEVYLGSENKEYLTILRKVLVKLTRVCKSLY